MSEVQQKVVEIIVDKLGVKESEVVPAFDIQIPDEDAEKIATVGDAIKYIEEHKK